MKLFVNYGGIVKPVSVSPTSSVSVLLGKLAKLHDAETPLQLFHSESKRRLKDRLLLGDALEDGDEVLLKANSDRAPPKLAETEKASKVVQGKVFAQLGKFREALPLLIEVLPHKEAYLRICQMFMDNHENVKALKWLNEGLAVFPDEINLVLWKSRALFESGKLNEAYACINAMLAPYAQVAADKCPPFVKECLVLIGGVWVKKKQWKQAAITLSTALQQDENHAEGLYWYAQVMVGLGKQKDALQMVLKSTALDVNFKPGKRLLAELVHALGTPPLLAHLDASGFATDSAHASALGYVATTLKDYGSVAESAEILLAALALEPTSCSYALNHAHAVECLGLYQVSVESLVRFFKRNPGLSIGPVSCADICTLLEDWEGCKGFSPVPEGWTFSWVPGENPHCVVTFEEGDPAPIVPLNLTLSAQQLDLLAMWMCLVKILYVSGSLATVPRLLQLIESVRCGQKLHVTTIRNEAAYYCCIAQLLAHEIPVRKADPITFVLGDSHVLPLAWRELTVDGEKRFLYPALVTGVKAWHLRKESCFYPKVNFDCVVNGMPPKQQVLVLIGEIDCREGIVLAVEKLRYESLLEGIRAVVAIFVAQVLLKLVTPPHEHTLLVHPVVPTLMETRPIVSGFNRVLEKVLLRMKDDRIRWIPSLEDRLVDIEGRVLPEFALDGTHLRPSYVRVLQERLAEKI